MLSGKQKAQLLLSVLGDQAQAVLSQLSEESSAILMAEVADSPQKELSILADLFQEIEIRVAEREKEAEKVDEQVSRKEAVSEEKLEAEAVIDDFSVDEDKKDLGLRDAGGQALREISDIAQTLSEQSPQIVAFVLSKIDESLHAKVLEYLPEYLLMEIKEVEVDVLPIGDHVFRNLYQSIFVVSDHDELGSQLDDDDPLGLF